VTRPPRTSEGAAPPEDDWHAPYDFEGIDLESGSTHADVVELVGEGKRVLELGPATGYMSRVFTERGCTVVAIERDQRMADRAAEHVERIIVGDLEALDLETALGDERFDAIVAADVLEHLREPLTVLTRLTPFLADDGFVVLSVPNVAHGSVRLALLKGEFRYQDRGLLDRTHLTFFTRESLEGMLDAAELAMAVVHRHELDLAASEVLFDDGVVPDDMRRQLETDPDARTYQFVVKAVPMGRPGLRELQRRMRDLAIAASDAERERDGLRALVHNLELQLADLAQIAAREGELRRSLVDAHDQLLRRDAELERVVGELELLRAETGRLEELRRGDRAWSEEQATALARQDAEIQALGRTNQQLRDLARPVSTRLAKRLVAMLRSRRAHRR
jgi:2-polyprenyl-3-methyl-5-hydroxy-6-metoxy-1,4-benzoquinol methylase